MNQADEYTRRIQNALEGDSSEDKATLVKEVVAVFADSIPNIKHGLDRYRARALALGSTVVYDDDGDLKKLIGKIRQQEEDRQRQVDEKYGTGTISSNIAHCDKLLASGSQSEKTSFCYKMGSVYTAIVPGFRDFLGFYSTDDFDCDEDIQLIREKLKEYRDSIIRETNMKPSQKIVASANSESASSSQANVEVNITNTIEAIDNMPSSVLSNDEKDELVALLQNLDREKGRGKDRFAKAGKKVVDYLFDKAIEAIPVALPYVIQATQGLF